MQEKQPEPTNEFLLIPDKKIVQRFYRSLARVVFSPPMKGLNVISSPDGTSFRLRVARKYYYEVSYQGRLVLPLETSIYVRRFSLDDSGLHKESFIIDVDGGNRIGLPGLTSTTATLAIEEVLNTIRPLYPPFEVNCVLHGRQPVDNLDLTVKPVDQFMLGMMGKKFLFMTRCPSEHPGGRGSFLAADPITTP